MDEKETGRVEAFSDGVFAVAITLLVLNIQPPPLSDPNLLSDSALPHYLASQGPALFAFVTSFATIGVMWMNHHKVFNRVIYVDNSLLALNLLLLLIVVFFPYPTALLSQQYVAHPEGHIAAIFYSAINVVLAICFNLLWRYATHNNRLIRKDADPQDIAAISRQYLYGPFVNLLIFVLAWINVTVCVVVILLAAIFFALPSSSSRKASQVPQQEVEAK